MATVTALAVGQTASITRAFSLQDVRDFALLSGDANPIHVDPDFARQTVFGQSIVHGMLVASLFSQLLAEQLPGPGTIYLGQQLRFVSPVYLDEEVIATVQVTHIREDKPIVTLRTMVTTPKGLAVDGEAVVKVEPGKRVSET